jgi:hypothetical protein
MEVISALSKHLSSGAASNGTNINDWSFTVMTGHSRSGSTLAATLAGNPGTVRLLELGKLLCRHDDGINASVFLNKHRLSFGLGADSAKTVLGLMAII